MLAGSASILTGRLASGLLRQNRGAECRVFVADCVAHLFRQLSLGPPALRQFGDCRTYAALCKILLTPDAHFELRPEAFSVFHPLLLYWCRSGQTDAADDRALVAEK